MGEKQFQPLKDERKGKKATRKYATGTAGRTEGDKGEVKVRLGRRTACEGQVCEHLAPELQEIG